MATWGSIRDEAPELVALATGFFERRVHKTIATVRADGSPRISGTEAQLLDDDLLFGAMFRSAKALDLLRDPRFALHSGSEDPPAWTGDAKVAGTAEEVTDPARKSAFPGADPSNGDWHLFRGDIAELVVVRLNDAGNALIVESWREGRAIRRWER